MHCFRGITTVEVMVTLIVLSFIILGSAGARVQAFKGYRDLLHRERALLFATETLEILEALKRTRQAQHYPSSWKNFLGNLAPGEYQLSSSQDLRDYQLNPMKSGSLIAEEDPYAVKIYTADIFTRLERRIQLSTLKDDSRLVTVSVFYGSEGSSDPESPRQVSLQSIFSDTTYAFGYAL